MSYRDYPDTISLPLGTSKNPLGTAKKPLRLLGYLSILLSSIVAIAAVWCFTVLLFNL